MFFLTPALHQMSEEKLLNTYLLGLAFMLQNTTYQKNFEVSYNMTGISPPLQHLINGKTGCLKFQVHLIMKMKKVSMKKNIELILRLIELLTYGVYVLILNSK